MIHFTLPDGLTFTNWPSSSRMRMDISSPVNRFASAPTASISPTRIIRSVISIGAAPPTSSVLKVPLAGRASVKLGRSPKEPDCVFGAWFMAANCTNPSMPYKRPKTTR